ncbi:MAG: DNA polymerase III subunit epsilon [Pseudomonadota bacterium]|nr:DNA polymerase III subunit epsilon [Pseudomonadota bacterium]
MNRQILLDTETTGLDPKSGHRVIEIGCVEIVNRKFTGSEFHTYLNPEREIDEEAEKIHGLSFEFLSDKPKFYEVLDEFLEYIKDSELLIHNAPFDIGFINHEIKLHSKKGPFVESIVDKITDTLQIAREKHPGQRNSLDALAQRYEIGGYDRSYHGAILDSKILGDVYLAMTGGQSDLFQANAANQKSAVAETKSDVSSIKDAKIVLTSISEDEEKRNLDYLKNMQEETGVEPVWLSKND